MTENDIQQLIDKYLDGETSSSEECLLARTLQRQGIPEEWQAIRLMLGQLALGEADYDDIMMRRKNNPSTVIIAIRTVLSAAAIYLVGLFFWLQRTPTGNPQTVYYNNKVEQKESMLQPPYCTEGTPRERLICYLEWRESKPNTYKQIKQMRYEDQ